MRIIKARSTSKKRKSTVTASESTVLSRLIGVETEYAFRYADGKHRNTQLLYHAIVASVALRMPLVQSYRNPNRCFLANGGSISWEPSMTSLVDFSGFIEAATPQCKQPKQLVAYAKAFDLLISEALHDPFAVGREQLPFTAIRNNCDAFGRSYGQQENYEVQIASGIWLGFWRLGLCLLFPWLFMHRLFAKLILMCTLSRACEREIANCDKSCSTVSLRVGRRVHFATALMQCCHAPLEYLFAKLCQLTVLRPQRHLLGGFLASRILLDGCGYVDKYGGFWISARARHVNSLLGFSGDGVRKPMIDLSHWFRGLCLDDTWNFLAFRKLFRARQRIQVCCGDTSTNELARWLQFGTTSLMFDLMETSDFSDVRSLRFSSYPSLMRRFARDPELEIETSDTTGRKWTAIELQEHYVQLVRSFLKQQKRVPDEAWEIVNAWQLMLARLRNKDTIGSDSEWLLARCDWHTKQSMLRRLPVNASFAVRKKIDIRYHEIGIEGYYQRIARFREISPLIDRATVDRAVRTPPDNTPATKRGYLIREFANSEHTLLVDWDECFVVSYDATQATEQSLPD